MNQRFITKRTFYQIRLWIRFQSMIKEWIIPTFFRPPIRFSPVFNSSPISKSYHLILIHTKERSSKFTTCCLTLINDQSGTSFEILGIINILIVETGHFGHCRQLRRKDFLIEVWLFSTDGTCPRRIHSHRCLTGRVITFHKHIENSISRNTPITGRKSGQIFPHLQFVAYTPHNNRRMISVTLDPFGNHLIP